MFTGLKIGELAARAGVSRDTIRFYEREALLPEPARTPAGYRLYRPEALGHLAFIKQAQALGFSLAEIREVLGGYHDVGECRHVEQLLAQKIRELDQKVRAIQSLRDTLSANLAACKAALASGRAHEGCPVLDDIAQHATRQQES
jgi:MerR family copper efflux transcriptional regulator